MMRRLAGAGDEGSEKIERRCCELVAVRGGLRWGVALWPRFVTGATPPRHTERQQGWNCNSKHITKIFPRPAIYEFPSQWQRAFSDQPKMQNRMLRHESQRAIGSTVRCLTNMHILLNVTRGPLLLPAQASQAEFDWQLDQPLPFIRTDVTGTYLNWPH